MSVIDTDTEAPNPSNVFALNGHPINPPGVPNPEVVQILKDALERAEAGDLQGIALIGICADDATMWKLCGLVSRGLVGTLEVAKFHLLHALASDD